MPATIPMIFERPFRVAYYKFCALFGSDPMEYILLLNRLRIPTFSINNKGTSSRAAWEKLFIVDVCGS